MQGVGGARKAMLSQLGDLAGPMSCCGELGSNSLWREVKLDIGTSHDSCFEL